MGEAGAELRGSGDMRAQVLNCAAQMLCESGYAGTTMRLIAKACGIKAASLYYHFPSKDDLVLEVLNEGIRQVDSAVRGALAALGDERPFRLRFVTAVRTHLQSFLGHGRFTGANLRTFKQTPIEVQARNMVLRGKYESLWRGLLEEGMATGQLRTDLDPSVMRLFLLGGMNTTVEWYQPGGLPLDELAEQYANLFIEGAGAKSGDDAADVTTRKRSQRAPDGGSSRRRSR